MSAAIVVCVVASSVAGAGAAPGSGDYVAKTTIGPAPSPTGGARAERADRAGRGSDGARSDRSGPDRAGTAAACVPTLPPATVDVATTEEAAGLSPESVAIVLPIFGLDAAKLQCVDAALPPFTSDDEAALAALQGCGVALMPLLRGIVDVAQRSNCVPRSHRDDHGPSHRSWRRRAGRGRCLLPRVHAAPFAGTAVMPRDRPVRCDERGRRDGAGDHATLRGLARVDPRHAHVRARR